MGGRGLWVVGWPLQLLNYSATDNAHTHTHTHTDACAHRSCVCLSVLCCVEFHARLPSVVRSFSPFLTRRVSVRVCVCVGLSLCVCVCIYCLINFTPVYHTHTRTHTTASRRVGETDFQCCLLGFVCCLCASGCYLCVRACVCVLALSCVCVCAFCA